MAFDGSFTLTSLLYTFLIALIITVIILKWHREWNYPPGPFGIPLIGYALFLGKKPHEKLSNLGRKYGDIYSLYIGPYLNVYINDYVLAKELLCNPKLLYRPDFFFRIMPGKGGIAGMNGEKWQEQRRFAFYTMRNLGLGKGLWETMIQEAVAEFTEELKNLKGQPKSLSEVLGTFHTSNVISLLFGRRLDKVKDAETLKIIDESIKELFKHFNIIALISLLPWLYNFFETFPFGPFKKFKHEIMKFEGIFKKEVAKRVQFPEPSERDDFIGCFFSEMKQRETATENHTFTREILEESLAILFLSSHDSTKASISWLLLYMAAYPDVQKRIHDEIDSVVGRDGIIYYDDKTKFPFTMATIFETFRLASISPVTPPRIVTEDMTINGYHVPKDSFLIVDLYAMMHDPQYFKDPMKFKPERFFTEENKVMKNLEGFLPFSAGKRNCPGEGIAIMSAFLYFASFLQKFKITMPPGGKVDLEPTFAGGGLLPKPQEICFLER